MGAVILGVDMGASRLRVAAGEWEPLRGVAIRAVAARDVVDAGDDARDREIHAILLEEALGELDVRTRGCVAALSAPEADVRVLNLPKMSHRERSGAAHLALSETHRGGEQRRLVRLHPIDRTTGTTAAATASREALDSRVRTLRLAGLRVMGVDYDGCALGRILCEYNAVLDAGVHRTRLHVYRNGVPATWLLNIGGATITRAIAADLSLDLESAEKRKRILGVAGAGEAALYAYVDAVTRLCEAARKGEERWERVAAVGNGSRLPGFASRLSAALNVRVELPVPEIMRSAALPETLAVAAPDWALACALATWSVAA